MKLGNKGQSGTVITVIVVMMTIIICALIMQELDTALSIATVATTWNTTWSSVSSNAVVGMNLTSLLPLLLGAGALIVAVYSFAKR